MDGQEWRDEWHQPRLMDGQFHRGRALTVFVVFFLVFFFFLFSQRPVGPDGYVSAETFKANTTGGNVHVNFEGFLKDNPTVV